MRVLRSAGNRYMAVRGISTFLKKKGNKSQWQRRSVFLNGKGVRGPLAKSRRLKALYNKWRIAFYKHFRVRHYAKKALFPTAKKNRYICVNFASLHYRTVFDAIWLYIYFWCRCENKIYLMNNKCPVQLKEPWPRLDWNGLASDLSEPLVDRYRLPLRCTG